ncbi:hypothetical protein M0R45_006267 [Rubus argutus]|uniref:Uncharacterized protein n=1 Tax=Rubus argutus TaxID=59490 RepID=A0AAW1YQE3_RUBAR
MGHMSLTLSLGTWLNIRTCTTLFVISDCPSAYNVILGHPALRDLMVRVLYCHLTLKFPTKNGVGKIRGDQVVARACYAADSKQGTRLERMDTMMVSLNYDNMISINEIVPAQEIHEAKRKLNP